MDVLDFFFKDFYTLRLLNVFVLTSVQHYYLNVLDARLDVEITLCVFISTSSSLLYTKSCFDVNSASLERYEHQMDVEAMLCAYYETTQSYPFGYLKFKISWSEFVWDSTSSVYRMFLSTASCVDAIGSYQSCQFSFDSIYDGHKCMTFYLQLIFLYLFRFSSSVFWLEWFRVDTFYYHKYFELLKLWKNVQISSSFK